MASVRGTEPPRVTLRWLGLLALATTCGHVLAAQDPASAPAPPAGMRQLGPAPLVPAAPAPTSALPLPGSPRAAAPIPVPPLPPPTGPGPAGGAFALKLFPGQVVQPIDLANALRLAGARNPEIAIARQRVLQAVADLEQARALWLPSLFIGPTYYRADGQIQTATGQVQNINRQSLFLGTTVASPNGFAAASPGTGYPQLNGLSSVLRISDAILEPMAARRVTAAQQAAFQATANDTLLGVTESYFNLQLAAGTLAIAREAAANAESLTSITSAYAQTGGGLEADHRRALAEFRRRRREIVGAAGQLKVASAFLIRPLVLDPNWVVAPAEPAETVLRLIPDDAAIDCLIATGLMHRPELAQAQETVQATLVRLRQAKLRPLVPAIAITYAGGGFGGGQDAFFGNFGARGDAMASLFWDIRNLGFTDLAICHRRKAENRAADFDLVRVQAQVASEVVAAYEARAAAAAQMLEASLTVTEAVDSLSLNFTNIRQGSHLVGATRPIEVLQPIQALALARVEYLEAVLAYNRSQFRLFRAIGNTPSLEGLPCPPGPASPPAPATPPLTPAAIGTPVPYPSPSPTPP